MAELIRPGVEVIQAFRTATPTFVRPTLVPVAVGPAFEVINVLNSDATINSKALYGDYKQVGKTITQLNFPDPRDNIDELDIQENSIRSFMLFGGNLKELLMNPGEGFLISHHGAAKAALRSAVFAGAVGLDLAGKTVVIAIDQPARLDTSSDVSVTFAGTGNLEAQECADQINEAFGEEVATVVGTAPNDRVQIASTNYGAISSVTVRAGGSANSTLDLGYSGGSSAHEERMEGSGYRGQDDNDNDTATPWIEFYRGGYVLDGAAPADPPADKAGLINIETAAFANARAAAVTFNSVGIPIVAGDYFYADGVKLLSGEIMKVEETRFKIGTINTALSVADDRGRYTTKVYDSVEVATLYADSPFTPKYTYFVATGLYYTQVAPIAATISGTTEGSAATAGTVESGVVVVPASLAGLKIHYVSTIDGVDTEGNFTFTGGPFANVAAIATAIGINIPGVTATDNAGKLKLTTTLTGRLQGITVKADGTANSALNFSTTTDTVGTGKDVEFVDIPANVLTSGQVVPTTALTGTTLIVQLSTNGGSTYTDYTCAFIAEEATLVSLAGTITAAAGWAGNLVASVSGSELSIKSVTSGKDVRVKIKNDAGNTAIGVNKIYYTLGQEDAGEEELNAQTLQFKLNYNPHIYEVTFTANSLDVAISDINSVVGATVASKTGTSLNKLKLTSFLKGAASRVQVLAGPAATAFGLSTSATYGSGRPLPDAYLDGTYNLIVNSELLRDPVTGYPFDQTINIGQLYIQFKALRRDVSPLANIAGVLRITDVDALSSVLDPITEDNPLGLALYLMLINAPGMEVKGLGVDEISAAAPEGTELAYARCAAMLETEEIYAMAPLTKNQVVHGMFATHVTAMSEPEQGGERIVFINKESPTRENPKSAASGTQAKTTATTNQLLLDVNPASGLVAAGVNPALPFTVATGVFVEIEVANEFRRYNVSSVTGTLANLNVTFAAGENDDGYYTTTALTETITSAAWAMKVRGDSLIVPGSNPPRYDYSLMAETIGEANASIKNRRVYSVYPDTVKTTISGIEKNVPGYYGCACIAGMVASQPPQQGFTNYPITGLTGVVGTEKFSKSQLNVMAGGGTYILMQEVPGGSVFSRHQLSTDLTSIETRELSITKVVDFVAKFIRTGTRKYIGTNNINSQFLDTIGTTIQGMLYFLVEAGVLVGYNLNQILQDETQPDTVLVDITLSVPYPCNYIRVTLVV